MVLKGTRPGAALVITFSGSVEPVLSVPSGVFVLVRLN